MILLTKCNVEVQLGADRTKSDSLREQIIINKSLSTGKVNRWSEPQQKFLGKSDKGGWFLTMFSSFSLLYYVYVQLYCNELTGNSSAPLSSSSGLRLEALIDRTDPDTSKQNKVSGAGGQKVDLGRVSTISVV